MRTKIKKDMVKLKDEHLGSNGQVDEKKVDILIVAGADRLGPKGKAACNELQMIYGEMQEEGEEMVTVKGVVYVICECMDNAFLQHLGAMSEVEMLFGNQRSHWWREVMREYMEQVIKELLKVITTITTMDMDMDEEEWEVLEMLKWLICMFNLMDLEKAVGVMLFDLRSVYSHMVHCLDMIDVSLNSLLHY